MKVVSKVKLSDVQLYKEAGYNIQFLSLPTAQLIFGDEVFVNCGTYAYVAVEINEEMNELLGVKVARL
jgi:hypothetical protein